MKLILESDESILLHRDADAELTIEAPTRDVDFSPFHMLAAALASCTFSVLWTWALQVGLDAEDLHLRVAWEFADEPTRVGTLDVQIHWAALPEARRGAARRAVELCTIHATLSRPTEIRISMGAS